jgi:hypothetical protein
MAGTVDQSRKFHTHIHADELADAELHRQIKYKTILKAFGLDITGNERYQKNDDGTTAITTPAKRKAEGKPAVAKKTPKKSKKDDEDDKDKKMSGGDGEGGKQKKKASTKATAEDENGVVKSEGTADDNA